MKYHQHSVAPYTFRKFFRTHSFRSKVLLHAKRSIMSRDQSERSKWSREQTQNLILHIFSHNYLVSLEVIIDYKCVRIRASSFFYPLLLPTSIKVMVIPACPHSRVCQPAIGEMNICSNIGSKSFKDGSQDICKDIESNSRPVTGF